jgi:very-short-patch-repair endonuclease
MGDKIKEMVGMAIIEEQRVQVAWHYSNKDWFTEKGHRFTKYGDEISVFWKDLVSGSKVLLKLNCDNCDKVFEQKNNVAINRENHFCTRDCYYLYIKNNKSPKNTRENVNCSNCDKVFEVKKYRFEDFKKGTVACLCCSRKCQNEFIGRSRRGENHHNYKDKIKINCQVCDDQFEVAPHRVESAKYCSVKCQRVGVGKQNVPKKKRIISCDNCTEKVSKWEHQINSHEFHFCSAKCRKEFQGHFVAKQQEKKDPTQCQVNVDNLLNNIGVKYKNEKPYDYYAVDNFLTDSNLIVEVQGDYWHGNPMVYSEYTLLNEMQKKRVKTDKSKKTHIKKKYDIDILYLWEKDINDNIEVCKKLVEYYISNQGDIPDYNSFNYNLTNGELTLNAKVIKPYYMRANTKRQVI